MAVTKDQIELEIVPPHATDYLRTVNTNMIRILKDNDEVSYKIPTLLERAKAFVNKDRYLTFVHI